MSTLQFIIYLIRLIFVPHSPKTMEWKMLKLLNKTRKEHKLQTFFMQFDLRKVARKHSLDMSYKNYFDHINKEQKSPSDRLEAAEISESISGENLAKIKGFPNPTLKAHIGLLNSPGHRANILNKSFNCLGIGIIKDSDGAYYFTQNFAKREIFLNKKVPRKTRISKNIIIKGKTKNKNHKLIYYNIIDSQEKVYDKSTVTVKNQEFLINIKFKKSGNYKINIFTPDDKKNILQGINQFKIKVKNGFFF